MAVPASKPKRSLLAPTEDEWRAIYLAEEMAVLYPGHESFSSDIFAVLDVPQPEDDERMAWVVVEETAGAVEEILSA